MLRPLLFLACAVATALPLGGQSTARLGANARLRVWSQTYALRGAEARLIDRWADTLLLSIDRSDAVEPLTDELQLSTAQIESLEYWSSTATDPRTVRNRYIVLGGIGAAILGGAVGGIFSFGEALVSATFVTLFVAAGSSETPQGAWVRLQLPPPGGPAATAPSPGAPDR
jgi:hypothetical protein